MTLDNTEGQAIVLKSFASVIRQELYRHYLLLGYRRDPERHTWFVAGRSDP